MEVKIDAQVLPKKGNFKYLWPIKIQGDGEIGDDVVHHIRAGWVKWRLTFMVLCHKNVSPRLKCMFYRMVVGRTLLYGI